MGGGFGNNGSLDVIEHFYTGIKLVFMKIIWAIWPLIAGKNLRIKAGGAKVVSEVLKMRR